MAGGGGFPPAGPGCFFLANNMLRSIEYFVHHGGAYWYSVTQVWPFLHMVLRAAYLQEAFTLVQLRVVP